jgi:hypothetical protein
MYRTKDTMNIKHYEVKTRYLTSALGKKATLTQKFVEGKLNTFAKDEQAKCMGLKSAFGTGKTVTLRRFLPQFKRIMWVSYRRTLTSDLHSKFETFNFSNYLTDNVSANTERVFIQHESIQRLMKRDLTTLPSYDLVVLDEIESILSSVDSETHRGKNKNNFNMLLSIARQSGKVIALDGDISNRSLSFLNSIGDTTCITNTYVDSKVIHFQNDENKFNDHLISSLNIGKKFYVACMCASDANYLHKMVENKTDKKSLLITSDMCDIKKKDIFDNINERLQEYDVVFASPTIESGVSFDVPDYFFQVLAILGDRSTSPRGFLQMLARVRKPESPYIRVLNRCFKVNNSKLWSMKQVMHFDDEYSNISLVNSHTLQISPNGIIHKSVEYERNYQFNQVERSNSQKYFFMDYLKMLLWEKQYVVFGLMSNKKMKIVPSADKSNVMKDLMIEDVLKCPTEIDAKLNADYARKREKGEATQNMKVKTARYSLIKRTANVDEENDHVNPYADAHGTTSKISLIKTTYGKNKTISNYLGLIDARNHNSVNCTSGQVHDNMQSRDAYIRLQDTWKTLKYIGFKKSDLAFRMKPNDDHSTNDKAKVRAMNKSRTIVNNDDIFKRCSELKANSKYIFRKGYIHSNAKCDTPQSMMMFLGRCLKGFGLRIEKSKSKTCRIAPVKSGVPLQYIVWNKLNCDPQNEEYRYVYDEHHVLNMMRPQSARRIDG